MRCRSFLTVVAVVVATATPGLAQVEPTVTDIAACNDEAAGRTGHPGALPGPRPGPGGIGRMPGPREGSPPTGGVEQPAQPRGPILAPPAGSGTGQKTDPSGSVITQSPDPLLKGMDAERVSDPAYRTAYRDCMQRRMRGR